MLWESFAPLFHESWHLKLKPFIESESCNKIYKFLKKESRRGRKIAPLSFNTFRAFKETSYDELKCVILGLSPYHTFYVNGSPIADGLAMSCNITGRLQPSLENWYNEIERTLYEGLNVHMMKEPDLKFLANQGVLLLNAALTTEAMKAGSHLKIWEPFIVYLFENVFCYTGVPIVFLGKEAARYKKYVTPFTWWFEVSHPASAAYSGDFWNSEDLFKKLNKVIKGSNGEEIVWAKTEQ